MANGTCSIDGCAATRTWARGWCRNHYERWRKYGDPLGGGPAKPPKVPRIGRTCSPEQAFWAKVKTTQTCWLWQGALDGHGYGIMRLGSKGFRAHRFSYAMSKDRALDVDLEIDHLCRVRNCVRPSHLEQVPGIVNILRSEGEGARNARKTHCPRDHEYTPENTYRWPGSPTASRQCRICMRQNRKR